jgi:hypothetical protein
MSWPSSPVNTGRASYSREQIHGPARTANSPDSSALPTWEQTLLGEDSLGSRPRRRNASETPPRRGQRSHIQCNPVMTLTPRGSQPVGRPEAAFRDTGCQRLRRRDGLRLTRLGRRGCSWRRSCPCADVRRCPNRHVKGLTERRRTAANVIMTAWQCGGGAIRPQATSASVKRTCKAILDDSAIQSPSHSGFAGGAARLCPNK